jgi:hypothetical protein
MPSFVNIYFAHIPNKAVSILELVLETGIVSIQSAKTLPAPQVIGLAANNAFCMYDIGRAGPLFHGEYYVRGREKELLMFW